MSKTKNRKASGHRLALMLSTSVLSMGAYGHLRSASAANECGVIAAGGTATCTPAGNNFTTGIDYDVNDATVILQDGVTVSTTANNTSALANGATGANLGNLSTTTQGTVNLTTTGTTSHGIYSGSLNGSVAITATETTTISTTGAGSTGITASSTGGNAITITAPGTITTTGSGSNGVNTQNVGGATTINVGQVTASGTGPITGIYAYNNGGTIDLTTSGVSVANGYGILAAAAGAGSGAVNVTTTGAVTGSGGGINAYSQAGSVTVNAGALVTTTGGGIGINTFSATGNLTVNSTGITANGPGIIALSGAGAINLTDTGTITTTSIGIYTYSTGSSTSVTVNNVNAATYGVYAYGATGTTVTTNGNVTAVNTAIGAYAGGGSITVTTNGTVTSTGAASDAIFAAGPASINITTNGTVTTTGAGDADGIQAYSYTGSSTITATNITATDDGINTYGQAGVTITSTGTITSGDEGIEAFTGAAANATVTVNNVNATTSDNDAIRVTAGAGSTITVNGAVLGGATSISGAGIDVRGGAPSVINVNTGGSIGALSDFAIDNRGAGATTLNNSGTITGSIVLSGGGDSLNNLSSNSVNLRRFTDTNADGIRDTEAVAILDFGAGTDTFDNTATGTLRLSTVTGATAFNTTNESFATGSAALSLTNTGIEQGHILNLETFINSGTITLADAETGGTGAVAGDVLAITSLGVPGVGGTSNFISNGGELHLDTVLNNGAVDTTDVLILDTVTTGAGGATGITITDAGGAGGITGTGATDGIRIVEVRGVGSASDAFTLSRAVVGGIFEYELNQADGQNWYLQSDGTIATQIPAYQALPLALSGFARDQMPWAQKRWGHVEGRQQAKTGAWLRGGYVRGSEEFTNSNQYESRNRFGQAGYDLVLDTDLPGALSIGGLLQHTSTDTSVTNGNGSTFAASGYGAGVSAYWTAGRGLFAEALATLTRYEVNIDRPNLAGVADTEAYTYSVGLQVGNQFLVAGETDQWTVTPRASLTYIDSDIDGFTDASGIAVDFAESDSMLLEAGMISGLDLDLQGNRVLNLSAEIGIEHNLLGGNSIKANGVTFAADRDDTRATVGAGATAHLGNSFSIFVRAEGGASLSGDGHTEQASAGMRITF
ncbi:MAG: autotransporter outer membrane beta-barrel domain-containing protein [Rhodobiaceae bacterium]|nr:autotransporter outer membrane beta-barrel domain-containing protein [Rhodobiaceae bacterium]